MAFYEDPGPDRVLFCTVGYARGPETRVYMDGSWPNLIRGEVVAALNGWVVDRETIDTLRDQLRQAEAEIERLRAERDDLEKRAVALGKDAVKLDDLRLSALRQAEAERDRARELAVWAVRRSADFVYRKNGWEVRFDSHDGICRDLAHCDGTDAGILAALEEAMGRE